MIRSTGFDLGGSNAQSGFQVSTFDSIDLSLFAFGVVERSELSESIAQEFRLISWNDWMLRVG